MCFSNFSQKTHQVLLWIGIHFVQQPSLVDRKSESATLLALEKKWKCNCAYPQKVESARTNCSGFVSLACFPSALHLAWQRKAIIALYLAIFYLTNLHISTAFTVPCWLRHWPQVCVNRSPKMNTCSGCSWRGADLELHKCSPTTGSHSEQTSWHLDVQMHLPKVKNMVNRSSSDKKKNWQNRFLKPKNGKHIVYWRWLVTSEQLEMTFKSLKERRNTHSRMLRPNRVWRPLFDYFW